VTSSTGPAAGVGETADPRPTAPLPGGFTGLDRRRLWAGTSVLHGGLLVLVVLRHPVRAHLDYAVPVLLVLLLVIASALLGGMRVALPGAVAGFLVLNWFFTEPFGTLWIESPEQVLVLVVFLVVSASVSWVVDVAARRSAEAARARAEAEALSSLAGATLAEDRTLTDVLAQVRRVFGMREAALLERGDDGWVVVEASSEDDATPEDETELTVPSGDDLVLRVRGPELFAADRRVLASFADAAGGALQGRRVAARAAEAAQLEAADRMRASLLAGVGHDLRTPLAAVKAAVSSLRQDDVDWTAAERAELLATIESSADRLQGLVGNLLDASRLEAGVVSTSLERVRVEELVGRALLSLGSLDRVVLDIPEDLPDVRADVGLAERVLANVLENALRHGGRGAVTVRARREGDAVVCDVVDHGPGVPPEAWDALFVPFSSGGALGDRGTGNLGLGLAVAHGFAEAMDAELTPLATPGGGLTMRFTLSLATSPSPGGLSAVQQRVP
jgi:two-component system sensor histidine kinase KdpD